MRTPDLEYGIHPPIDSSTLAFWPCDEGNGLVAADIVGGRDVARGAGVTWVSALIGKGVDTNTMTGGLINTGAAAGADAAVLQGDWTLEVWVRPMAGTAGSIIEYSDPTANLAADNIQCGLQVNADLTFKWIWENGAGVDVSQNSTAALRAGVWQHIAITKEDPGSGTYTVTTYLNGVQDNQQTGKANATGGGDAYWNLGTGKAAYFKGRICSAHITRSVLTSGQIRDNWRRGMLWEDPSTTGSGKTDISVTIAHASGSITLNSLQGFDYVQGFQIRDSVDEGIRSCTLMLKREIYDFSLSPLVTASALNQNPQPVVGAPGPDDVTFSAILALRSTVTIKAARRSASGDPAASFTTIYSGSIDSIDWAGESIRVELRDSGSVLADKYIEAEAIYNEAAMESVMAAILTANGLGAVSLYTPTSPSFTVVKYKQRRESVLGALTTIADLIGWIVKFRWDPLTDQYRLTLYDPGRSRSRIDGILNANDYPDLATVTTSITDIRNKVRVTYSDSSQAPIGRDDNDDPIYPRESLDATNPGSITAYGTRFMEISESASSQIDTQAEAQALAEACLADLATPSTLISGKFNFWEIEIGDRLLMEADGKHFDTDLTAAVRGISYDFTEGMTRTTLELKGNPVSHVQGWLTRESAPGKCLPPTRNSADSTVDFGARGLFAPLRNLGNISALLRTSPTLAGTGNPGFLVHPDGTGAIPIGWNHGSASWGSTGDVYFTVTNQNSGDRALALNNVGASVTSAYFPVMGGRTYRVRVQWNGTDAADKLQCDFLQAQGDKTAISTTTIFHEVITSAGSYQVDEGTITTAANARYAQVKLTKTVGGTIYVDRVQCNPLVDQFSAQYSAPSAISTGTVDFKPNTENFDYGSQYNNGTGDFTANEPGLFRFQAQVELTATSTNALTGASVALRVGGVFAYGFTFAPPSGRTTAIIPLSTPLFALDAGDVVDIQVTIPANCFVSGWFSGGRDPISDP